MGRTYITSGVAEGLLVSLGQDPRVLPGERWFLSAMGREGGDLDVVLGFEPVAGSGTVGSATGQAMYWDGHGWEPLP